MHHDIFIEQTRAWIDGLDRALWACYEWHPHLGDIPRAGMARRIRKIKRVKDKARRRLNYHLHAGGYPTPIVGAMMFINQADSGYF
jgi:phosphoserine phosphatase